jgi:hypothetical protein
MWMVGRMQESGEQGVGNRALKTRSFGRLGSSGRQLRLAPEVDVIEPNGRAIRLYNLLPNHVAPRGLRVCKLQDRRRPEVHCAPWNWIGNH